MAGADAERGVYRLVFYEVVVVENQREVVRNRGYLVHELRNGGSSLTRDLAIERHAEVVASYRGVIPDNSSITRDPNIERHAEVVAEHNRGFPQ